MQECTALDPASRPTALQLMQRLERLRGVDRRGSVGGVGAAPP